MQAASRGAKRPALSSDTELGALTTQFFTLVADVSGKSVADIRAAAERAVGTEATILDLGLTSAMGISLKGMTTEESPPMDYDTPPDDGVGRDHDEFEIHSLGFAFPSISSLPSMVWSGLYRVTQCYLARKSWEGLAKLAYIFGGFIVWCWMASVAVGW